MTLEFQSFTLNLRTPLQTAAGTITKREGFIVRLADDELGIGEATPLSGWTESRSKCKAQLHSAKQLYETDGLDAALTQLADTPAARHGVTLAIADRRARVQNRPLYQDLGQRDTVTDLDVNATIGAFGLDEILDAVDVAVQQRYRTLKIKIGLHDLSRDIEILRTVRSELPQDINLRADVNGSWAYHDVVDHISDLRAINLEYLEQPFPPEDLDSHQKLRAASIPIALDETLQTNPISRILSHDAADFIVIKPMSIGGINKARSIATTCLENDVLPVITTTYDGVIARTAAIHLTASLPQRCPAGLATGGALASDLTTDPAPVNDGRITVPQSPGIGIQSDFL